MERGTRPTLHNSSEQLDTAIWLISINSAMDASTVKCLNNTGDVHPPTPMVSTSGPLSGYCQLHAQLRQRPAHAPLRDFMIMLQVEGNQVMGRFVVN